jgi:uncharacterized protein
VISSSVGDLFRSPCFWSAVCAWLVAQFCKMLNGLLRTRRLDFRYLVSTGGMPSAHSAMVSGLAAAVGFEAGFGSPEFVLALALAAIVTFDAATVRRAAGIQARLLNDIVAELFKAHHLSERKVVELLGHTRLEVFLGVIIGVLVSMIIVPAAARFGPPW